VKTKTLLKPYFTPYFTNKNEGENVSFDVEVGEDVEQSNCVEGQAKGFEAKKIYQRSLIQKHSRKILDLFKFALSCDFKVC
jgi:hypothetical protein